LDFILPQRDHLVLLKFLLPENSTAADYGRLAAAANPTSSSMTTSALLRLSDLWATNWGSLSPEYLNLAFALVIYSISYSMVFWEASKAFAGLMSVICMCGAVLVLIAHAGFSVLYKIEVLGGAVLLNRPQLPDEPYLMLVNFCGVVIALYAALAFTVIVLCPSVVYFYGYQKMAAFLCRETSRNQSAPQRRPPDCKCVYLLALIFMLLESAWVSPLVYDAAIVYRGSLDCSVLAASVASISHLAIWVVAWLVFILVPRWNFVVRVIVSKSQLVNPMAVRMVAEIEHNGAPITDTSSMVVVTNGRAFPINDVQTHKAVMAVIQRTGGQPTSKALIKPTQMIVHDDGSSPSRRAHTLPARSMLMKQQMIMTTKYVDNNDRALAGARMEYDYGDGNRPDQPLLQSNDRRPAEGQEAEEPRYGTRSTINTPLLHVSPCFSTSVFVP
jgi:hypothetical protein